MHKIKWKRVPRKLKKKEKKRWQFKTFPPMKKMNLTIVNVDPLLIDLKGKRYTEREIFDKVQAHDKQHKKYHERD